MPEAMVNVTMHEMVFDKMKELFERTYPNFEIVPLPPELQIAEYKSYVVAPTASAFANMR